MVAVFPLIGKTLLQPSGQMPSGATLGLRQTISCLSEFVWMQHLLACGQRKEMQKAGINANSPCASNRNHVRLGVYAEAEVPSGRTFDDPTTFQAPRWKVLPMEPHSSHTGHMDTCPGRRFERIRKRNTAKSVAPAFELGLLGQLLIASLPGKIRRIQHALQRVTGDAELFAVVCKQIVEGFLAVIHTVFGILFDFPNGPIPHPCKLEQPGVELFFLRGVETELQLSLDHATPVSGFRCTA
jgi:hypothetical protein